MMQLPKAVLDLFPMWQCGLCGHYFDGSILFCPKCGGKRQAPDFLKNYDLMAKYAHEILMPSVSRWKRRLLTDYFTIFFTSGFESEDNTFTIEWTGKAESTASDHITVETTHPHTGSKNAQAIATNGGNGALCYKSVSASANMFSRGYYQYADMPSTNGDTLDTIFIGDGAVTKQCLCGVNKIGTELRWQIASVESATNYYSEAAPSNPTTGVWYCQELNRNITDGEVNLWIDSVLKVTGNPAGMATNSDTVSHGIFSNFASETHTLYVDDCAIADARIGCALGGAKKPYFCAVPRHMNRNVRGRMRQFRYG